MDIQAHVLFLENQIRYHETQVGWSVDEPIKKNRHLTILNSLREIRDCLIYFSGLEITLASDQKLLKSMDKKISNAEQTSFAFESFSSSKKKRTSRGQPAFFLIGETLKEQFPKRENRRTEETSIPKQDYDCIVEAFDKETDPSGRIRWGAAAMKDVRKVRSGIHDVKVQAVKRFLIKIGVLQGDARSTYVINKGIPLLQQGANAWRELQLKKILK